MRTTRVLALHGSGTGPALWDELRAACPDLEITAPDLNALVASVEADVEPLVAAIEALAPDGPIVVAGSSVGAHLALEVAARRGADACGVLLVSPGPVTTPTARRTQLEEMSAGMRATTLDAFMDTALSLLVCPDGPRADAAREATRAMLEAGGFEGAPALVDVALGLPDPAASLERVSAAVRVLAGAADPTVEAEWTETWRGAPHVEGPTVLDRVAHLAPVEAPDVVAEALRALVA